MKFILRNQNLQIGQVDRPKSAKWPKKKGRMRWHPTH